jgi:glucose-1-phosphate thymidylyltransferase
VCLDGPLFVGPEARVNPHAWLRAGTVLGMQCRAGGEIEATVMEPFSNKPHDGFLGHSHLGSWVNLAAGTVTSNLKATYGPVRLHELQADGSRTTVHTGRQFCGASIGDLARTAINTSIPCGARIGVAATVQGSVAESVPAFANNLLGGRSTAEQAATVLGRMMERRGLGLVDADRGLLEVLAGEGMTG